MQSENYITENEVYHYITLNGIRSGRIKTGLKFDCFTLPDDIVYFAQSLEIVAKQQRRQIINIFRVYGVKNIDINDFIWVMRPKYDNIKGDILTQCINKNAYIEQRARKMDIALRLPYEIYNS